MHSSDAKRQGAWFRHNTARIVARPTTCRAVRPSTALRHSNLDWNRFTHATGPFSVRRKRHHSLPRLRQANLATATKSSGEKLRRPLARIEKSCQIAPSLARKVRKSRCGNEIGGAALRLCRRAPHGTRILTGPPALCFSKFTGQLPSECAVSCEVLAIDQPRKQLSPGTAMNLPLNMEDCEGCGSASRRRLSLKSKTTFARSTNLSHPAGACQRRFSQYRVQTLVRRMRVRDDS